MIYGLTSWVIEEKQVIRVLYNPSFKNSNLVSLLLCSILYLKVAYILIIKPRKIIFLVPL